MTNEPPDHCPHCGDELTPVDPPTVQRCGSCDRPVFYNPTPSARVAVVDDDELLLCGIGIDDVWETPGGRVEGTEDPPVTAARELREETGLRVDPADLRLFDVRSFESLPGRYKTRLCYAIDRSTTEGTITPGDEHVEARFWSPEDFERASATLSDRQPVETQSLRWWLRESRAARRQST